MDSNNSELIVNNFKWDTEVTVITIIGTVILMSAIISVWTAKWPIGTGYLKYLIIMPLLFSILYTASSTPVKLKFDGANIVIKKAIGRIQIPLSQIENIEEISPQDIDGSIRTFGSGGFFGYLGRFRNDRIGHYKMYATNRKNLLLIKTTNASYVVSCPDSSSMVNKIRASLIKQ